MDNLTVDVIGIGVGPFNLGLAALLDEKTELSSYFFDESEEFDWHPGMLLEHADLQVPFLADLVTFANPKSRYSFLNYLHTKNRLYKFYFYRKFDIPRKEYNDYARWVVKQLPHCVFKSQVIDVIDKDGYYEVHVNHWDISERKTYYAKNIIMGTGSKPLLLKGADGLPKEDVHHSSDYLYHKPTTVQGKSITVIGSGQSAAEIFYDLLQEMDTHDFQLTWFTRSPGIFQLDESKLGQEVFTPDYVDYFHQLPFAERMEALQHLKQLRKGIEGTTLTNIYHYLYDKSIDNEHIPVSIQPLTELEDIQENGGEYTLACHQWELKKRFTHNSEKVILATGYQPHIPDWFTNRFRDKIEWEDDKHFKVTDNYQLQFKEAGREREHHFYTLTNLDHAYGSGATNLALSVNRNIQIINDIAGEGIYPMQRDTSFSQFF
ncbi:SidA/IucD/PvdA family monooxygenase [Aquibacillus koreensis]|uniref:L-lysine N6-monooxygenase MbtG n=1 Tax=Aquibacillus koreensis TaxID=279446 RepID=A0A9X4AHN4_9BACI|nr:SidA/IucD/PvdA family monooxygenase [Aquibacillus koreensis]MCT2537128.1 SidA/IucD/PvdA family monooxygenase [Aquibacillus koreensis]MDC3419889.1 SidA/IucD/PvdA family monooxygenase [Aquibacillus koreensis]